MHGDVRLGGFIWTITALFVVVAAALALFVTVDTVRRSLRNGRSSKGLWVYMLLEAVYLGMLVLSQFTMRFRIGLGAATAIATPFAIGVGVTYLLKIVYPKPHPDSVVDEEPEAPEDVDDAL